MGKNYGKLHKLYGLKGVMPRNGGSMNSNYDVKDMRTVNEQGFVTPTFWDRSIRLMTIDENGMAVDCYDRVVDDLKDKESNVVTHFQKEERKNKIINFIYNMQKRVLITNVIFTNIACSVIL